MYCDSAGTHEVTSSMLHDPLLAPSPRPAALPVLRFFAVASSLAVIMLCTTAAPLLVRLPSLSAEAAPLTVLVTGFEPFGNLTSNPAEEVARRLNGSCTAGVCLEGWSLAVDGAGVEAPAERIAAGGQHWDAVIHLGFESVAKGLRIETMAANVKASNHSGWSADVPCNKTGTVFEDVHRGAPCLLATTAPLDALALPLLPRPGPASDATDPEGGGEAPELWSRDAGVFFCNEIYFRSLRAVRANLVAPGSGGGGRGRLLPVVFIHLPPLNTSSVMESADFVRSVAERLVSGQAAAVQPQAAPTCNHVA